ncbi:MAG TPA: DHA2 family efflux MFS transporter permease subunit, partial [Burkholderiales bacterium]|nr:DHA2 family efflux MFS transporter permease subunit [Burkholderiales bacterium]
LTGWLTERYGQVRLFVATILLFVLASLLCGFAPSIEVLILFRVIQGAVAGPMIPLSQTLLLASYPKEKSGMALAMFSLTILVAPVVGPLLGGWITDNISWPWIFFINVPVGLVSAALAWVLYRGRESPRRRMPIDAVGLVLLVVWVGALQVMLDKGKDLDWFASGIVVALAVAAALGFALFLAWELTERHPVVDLHLFARRNFWTGTLAISLSYGAYFASIVLLPLWLQQFMGYTATQAGMALAPVGVLALVLTPLVGKNINKVDPRVFATIALVVFAFVSLMRGGFSTQVDFDTIIIPTVIQGAALSCFFIPLVTLSLSGLAQDQIASASGLNNFARILAGAFGTSIATTLWDHRATLHHAQLAEHVTRYDPAAIDALAKLGSTGLNADQAYGYINQLVNQQAFTLAALDVFNASAVLLVLLIPLVWMARPAGQRAGVPAGAH